MINISRFLYLGGSRSQSHLRIKIESQGDEEESPYQTSKQEATCEWWHWNPVGEDSTHHSEYHWDSGTGWGCHH